MVTNGEVNTTTGYTDVGVYRIRYTIIIDSTQNRIDASITNLATEQSLGYANISKDGSSYINIYPKAKLSIDDRQLLIEAILLDIKAVFTTD